MKKAIKFFEEEITRLENAPKINGCEMTDEWAEQIEICKTAKSAIEKQIPKKVISTPDHHKHFCPACHQPIKLGKRHCASCGQKIGYRSETE